MKQIKLTDVPVSAIVFVNNKRCEVVRQYTGFSWLKDEDGNKTGEKVQVKRTKLQYISTYQYEFNGKEGLFYGITAVTCERTLDSDGIFVMAE